MVVRHLRRERFSCGNIAEELYQLKQIQRSGWVKRGIASAESVADHVYGAYLLALLYLPGEYPPLKGYSKAAVINMLLIHELAEAYTGDVLPEHKDELARRMEAEHFEYLALLGTYGGVDRMTPVLGLWRAFQSGSEINSQIAKEIDKLENLLQLYIYRKDGWKIADYVEWERGLCDAISTPIGLTIREIIRSAFPDLIGEVKYTAPKSMPQPVKRSDRRSRSRRRRPTSGRPRK
jgi:5'-deoxynucleotidase YfbR-like HD superfamily hydrolase